MRVCRVVRGRRLFGEFLCSADRLWTLAELERALEPYDLTVEQFKDEPEDA